MKGLDYTAVHVRKLLSLNRSELQRWLAVLPPFCDVATQVRSARVFTMRDLAFFSAVAVLQKQLDLPIRKVSEFSVELHARISATAALSDRGARIYLNRDGTGGWRVAGEPAGTVSLSLDPASLWVAVYRFVGIDTAPTQRELPLGLVSIPPRLNEEPVRGHRTR